MIDEIKKFISYFMVGGMAAIVEWVSFAIFNSAFSYVIATILAFLCGTTANYFLGKSMTFKNYKKSKKDVYAVFTVSAVGLILNVILMRILIEVIHVPIEMIAKIISTGIVFMWNYISRRLFVYKEEVK